MSDKKIKSILKNDDYVPTAPVNELNLIHNKIEEQSTKYGLFFRSRTFALACCSFILFFTTVITYNQKSNLHFSEKEQSELISYMLEDNYLSDEIEIYAWAETSL